MEGNISVSHIRDLEREAKAKSWSKERLEQEKEKLKQNIRRVGFTKEEREKEREKARQLQEKAKELGYSSYAEQINAERRGKVFGFTEKEKEAERELKILEEKAKELGYSSYKEQLTAQEKGLEKKILESNLEAKEKLEERARDLGYSSYSEQRRETFRKNYEEPFTRFNAEKVVVAPPLNKKIEALEFTDPKIPGEIKIDKSGKLLKRYFAFEGAVGSLIDQYNNFITHTMIQHISSRGLELENGKVTFENLFLDPPKMQVEKNVKVPYYPKDARDKGYTYSADIYIDMVLNKGTVGEERIQKVQLGKIPVMLGSALDWLSTKSESEKVQLGEGLSDPLSYFIVKGQEKIIKIQEKLRANRFFLFNSTSKGDVVCKITNNTLMGTSQITMVKGKKSGALKIHLGFLGREGKPASNKLGNTMMVFSIFRLLGVQSKDILKYIYLFTRAENRKKIFVALQPSFIKMYKHGDDIEYISKKLGTSKLDYNIRKTNIMVDLLNQLFPQIPPDDIQRKIYMLSIMTVRLVEYLIGARELDDRDNWGNKQLVTAGKSMELLFSSVWKEMIKNTQEEVNNKKLTGLNSVKKILETSFITDNFIESFTANNWGLQSSFMTKENITDFLKRDSLLAVYSHLTLINTPTSSKGKASKIRMVQMSQLGYIGAAETPEGEQCGLNKNSAMTNYISLDRPKEVIYERVKDEIADLPSETHPNSFILNGIFQGWVNGERLRKLSLNWKRSKIFPKDTSIVLEKDGVFNIYTDSSRPTRPLLTVNLDGKLVIDEKNLWEADFETLLEEGCVEYVDAWEQESIMLAQTLDDIEYREKDIEKAKQFVQNAEEKIATTTKFFDEEDKKNAYLILSQARVALKELTDLQPYTHSEMDPSAILTIAVGIIPLPETNPGPRLTYQAGMGKQSLGIYHSNHASRFDTTSKLLAYPSRPMFETQINEVIGLNELPAGETVILAITVYGGFSQEDSIIMAKGAIDRGLFRSVVYKTYKSVIGKKVKNTEEYFARPEIKKGEERRYSAIDERGIPRLGSFLKEGDCIIGKVRKNFITGKIENASSFVEVKQEGIVDRVLVTTNSDGNRVVKVKIRQVRKPVMGDKYACYTPDHEILTLKNGWIPISNVTTEDEVATLVPDINGDRLVYQNPSEVQTYDYDGKMYHIKNQQIDLCVTPNHRMYIKPRRKDEYIIKNAEDIFGKRVRYKKDACYFPEIEVTEIEIPAYNEDQVPRKISIEPFCTLFGIFIAEGWVSSGTRFPHRIDIAGNKNRVRDGLKEVCEELNIKYSSESKDKKFYIWDNQIGEYLRQFSIGAINKYLPEWCFQLSQENSRLLLEGLMLGDGHKTKQTSSYTYYTSSKRLAGDVTQLALHAGWSGNSKIRFEAGSKTTYNGRDIVTTTDGYAIPIIRSKNNPEVNHGHVKDQNIQVEEWVEYKGNVHCCTVESGIIYVRRNGKPVWCGNSRYAQKGTIGLILPDEDMPFTSSGVRPDIIINPHAIPSRMTIGKLIEILTSKTASFTGERVNATAFRRFNSQEFMRNLKEYGYSGSGKERLYSGFDGKPLEAMIYIGPCYYQALRHQVADKIQMRARGDISQLTRQPVGGRKRGGGQRVGEMERDAIISHGAANILRERLCLVSDAYETVYCGTCGNIAISNIPEDKYVCRVCEEEAVFGTYTVPYAYKHLTQLLIGAGIQTKFKFKSPPK
jgi:DNA-directed RNA polymerase II subunit RPB2